MTKDTAEKTAANVQTAPGGVPPQVPALRTPAATRDAPAPRKRLWPWLAGGIIAIGLGIAGYVQPWAAKPPVVTVEIAALAPTTRVLAVNGRIAAAQSVNVRPLVGGALAQLLVAEGDKVEAVQVLAKVNTDAQNAVMRQAIAGLDAALVAQTGARETYERSTALGRNVAQSVLDSQGRALQSAGQEVARLTAFVDQARIALENHTIRAPITGSVLTLNVDPGQIVDQSTVLMTLADLTDLLVKTDVDEAYATQILQGQPAVLQLAGESGTHAGRVSFVSSRVDVATGGLAVELTFDTPVTAPIGLTVTANIVVDQSDAALTLPRTALATSGTEKGVFLVRDNTARFQPVQVVDWPAARLIVSQGLAAGDAVIVDGAGLEDGQAITVGQP